jgi:alkyl sulfatase BDS1-like metallo-beta-lactamase superfamily hydrolase
MASPTEDFFDTLARRGHVPEVEHEHGRLRFELVDGPRTDHWLVSIDDGDVTVSRDVEDADVDAVFSADRSLFDQAVVCEGNVVAAYLRGEVGVKGNMDLIATLLRLLQGPAA